MFRLSNRLLGQKSFAIYQDCNGIYLTPYTISYGNNLACNFALAELLPWKAQNVLNIVIDVINVIILAVLTFYSVEVLQRIISSGENSPAMLMPMWI